MHDLQGLARQGAFFLLLLAVVLGPALINGYPFYFADSPQYDGHLLRGFHRSATPALVSAPLYPFIGVWSLVVINATVFSLLVTKYTDLRLSAVTHMMIAFLVCITLAPFYVSFLMPDIWIVFLFISVLLIQERFSWQAFTIAVLACSGHGSHAPILGTAAFASFLFGFMPLRVLRLVAIIIATSLALTYVLDNVIFKSKRISTAVVASKIMNDVPQAFVVYCEKEAVATICGGKERIGAMQADGIRDDQYLWAPGIWRGGSVSLSEFNSLGLKLWWIAVIDYPLIYLRESAADFWRLIHPTKCIGYRGFVERDERWIRHLNQFDLHTLARRGFFRSRPFCTAINWIVVALSVIGILALVRIILVADIRVRSHAFFLASGIIGNAAFFALTSGPFARYHLRILPLVGIIITLWLTMKRREKAVSGALPAGAEWHLETTGSSLAQIPVRTWASRSARRLLGSLAARRWPRATFRTTTDGETT